MTDELSKGFTGIEINGVRFSNVREMLVYMNKQRDQLTKAKEILKMIVDYYPCYNKTITEQAEQFLKEIEK